MIPIGVTRNFPGERFLISEGDDNITDLCLMSLCDDLLLQTLLTPGGVRGSQRIKNKLSSPQAAGSVLVTPQLMTQEIFIAITGL